MRYFQLVLPATGVYANLFEKLKGVTEIKIIFSSHVSVRTLYKLEWQVFILAWWELELKPRTLSFVARITPRPPHALLRSSHVAKFPNSKHFFLRPPHSYFFLPWPGFEPAAAALPPPRTFVRKLYRQSYRDRSISWCHFTVLFLKRIRTRRFQISSTL